MDLWEAPVAHRGLHGRGVPENSLPAFEAARRLGLPVELDVRVTADGVAVVHHDMSLLRVCGQADRIDARSASEVTRLPLAGTAHRVPTLVAALDTIGTDVPVLVDCKVAPRQRDRMRMLHAVLRALRGHRGTAAVVGFDPWLFAALHDLAPGVLRGQSAGVSNYESRAPGLVRRVAVPLDKYWLNGLSRPHFLTHNIRRLPQPALRRLRDRGLPVLGWTVRDVADLPWVTPLVDNVIAEGEAMQHLLRATAASAP